MKLLHEEFLRLINAVSLAPSNLIIRDRIRLIERAFVGTKELEKFLTQLDFDGPSRSYSTMAVKRMKDYGPTSDGEETLILYLRVVSKDFNLSKDYQIPHKKSIDDFLAKYE